MTERESGLTFLFTDVEGSTRLLRDLGHTYGLLIRIHRRILQTCSTERGGREMGNEGDAEFFVFRSPDDAVAAAVTAQRKLEQYAWPEGIRLRVRMGLHCGAATVSGGEYVGLAVHEVARICAAAHGGQVICSSAVTDGLDATGDELSFTDLGAYRLRDIPDPWTLYQVCAPGLEEHFPPLRGAVREGGSLVTVWRRDAHGTRPAGDVPDLAYRYLAEGVEVEVGRASTASGGTFRLVVRRRGVIEEEFDGLTVGGPADAAGVVNVHSLLLRIDG
ncbi:MAG TPA: adenylate/guanylate cyclase domain-containing protein [Acidimicrobiales bacterium]|nr:adenylate/guanylate cyclase domain-containing protein [Acidimicrobiales bacterium]